MSTERRSIPPLAVAIAGAALVTIYAALAVVQILVLNPLAVVPGATLAEINAQLAAANESLGGWFVVAFLSIGPLVSLALVFAARRRDASARGAAGANLVILFLGSPAYFVASFGPGMALADTFFISGADASPWATPLHIVSTLALGGLIGLMVGAIRRAPTPAVG